MAFLKMVRDQPDVVSAEGWVKKTPLGAYLQQLDGEEGERKKWCANALNKAVGCQDPNCKYEHPFNYPEQVNVGRALAEKKKAKKCKFGVSCKTMNCQFAHWYDKEQQDAFSKGKTVRPIVLKEPGDLPEFTSEQLEWIEAASLFKFGKPLIH